MKIGKRDGQALIVTVMFTTVLMTMVAAGVSIGSVYVAKDRLQQAVNTVALAAAQAILQGDSHAPGDQAYLVDQNDPGAADVSVTDNTTDKVVTVTAQGTLPGGFAAVAGIKTFTVRAEAQASYGPGAVFNYAIFQGSTTAPLCLPNDFSVKGDVRANQNVVLGSTMDGCPTPESGGGSVSGTVQATGTVAYTNQWGAVTYDNNVPVMAMPNWSAEMAQLPQNGTVVNGNFSVASNTSGYDGDVIVNNGDVVINGATQFTGDITVNDPVGSNDYVVVCGDDSFNGSLTVTGANVYLGANSADPWYQYCTDAYDSGVGISGNVIVNGGNLTVLGDLSEGSGGQVALAALQDNGQGGNITLGGPGSQGGLGIDGLVYAPEGTVSTIDPNGWSITGAVAGENVNLGGNSSVTWTQVTAVPTVFQQAELILPGSA